jgi:hypothetical protein
MIVNCLMYFQRLHSASQLPQFMSRSNHENLRRLFQLCRPLRLGMCLSHRATLGASFSYI